MKDEFMPTQIPHPASRPLHWKVQEGAAQELAQGLESCEGRALVFLSNTGSSDPRSDAWTKAIFGLLRRASEIADVTMDRRQQESWDAIIDALTPTLPLSTNRVLEARMVAQAMTAIVESEDFARASDIAELGHFSSTNPSSQPNRWKKAGLIFAVPYKGVDLYPLYALELHGGAKPLPIVKKILSVLRGKDEWQKAFWFASPNTYLKSKAPKDLLKLQPQDVLRAAQTEAEGVLHG